jgi:hypothetical protein
MSESTVKPGNQQKELLETDAARSLLDQLLTDSRLYTQSKDYKALLDFVVRLRNFAPFNAMLLQVQKPGLSYAASARDWRERFGRTPKEGARPLLILWPFGPVALVYDVLDTEGEPLPEDVASFFAHGSIDKEKWDFYSQLIAKKDIELCLVDAGDQNAGSIRVIKRATKDKEATQYRMHLNRNHEIPVQFATLAHELGHLFLGHLGPDRALNVPERPAMSHAQREIEAESVAYLVCARNGVKSKSETYLTTYVGKNTTIDHLDLYQVMRAAGQVETLLGLTAHTKYDNPTPSASCVGVLAYGSLVSDPGTEMRPVLMRRIPTITPFPVEYGRLSATRGGGPTVVPHSFGKPVKAEVFVLCESVSLDEAKNLLWRRETRHEGSGRTYDESTAPNAVVIRDKPGFCGLAHVLYTDFNREGKLENPEPKALAEAAIGSLAKAQTGKDGISYLMDLLDRGVETALTPHYVDHILALTGAASLASARDMLANKIAGGIQDGKR